MKRKLVLGALLGALLTPLSSGMGHFGVASAAAAAAAKSKSSVLYDAKFNKLGAKGWDGGGDPWKVAGGSLTFDGSTPSGIVAPFQTKHLKDFAVQATIAAGSPTGDANAFHGYGIIVSKTVQPHSGVFGLVWADPSTQKLLPALDWGTDYANAPPAALNAGPNVFRMEVHGTVYTFFINGQQVSQFKIPDFKGGTYVGVDSENYSLAVSSFKVISLKKAHPKISLPMSVKTANLTESDAKMPLVAGEWTTPEYSAFVSNTSVDTVKAAGFLGTYRAEFAPSQQGSGPDGLNVIYSQISAYTSADNAHAGLQRTVASDAKAASSNATYKQAPWANLGDEATFSQLLDNNNEGWYNFMFRVGSYRVVMHFGFPANLTDAQKADVLAMAQTVAQRLKSA